MALSVNAVATLSREVYVQRRIAARYQERGDPITLRRVTLVTVGNPSSPVPYQNPPDYSADLVVTTGISVTGQAYLGMSGTSAIGRLVPNDVIVCSDNSGVVATWQVQTMPTAIATDSDGIPKAATNGTPILGTATPYCPDSLAADNKWTVIPVLNVSGDSNPAHSVSKSVRLQFRADVLVYGVVLSLTEMTFNGWTEVDAIGLNLAAYNGGEITPPPKVDDWLIVNGQLRAIITANQLFRRGTQLVYPVQAK
jgi:hypothetical protein